jgi:hypothetical protein
MNTISTQSTNNEELLKQSPLLIKDASIILLVLIALFGITRAWQYGQRPQSAGLDFYQFWVVGKAVRDFKVTNIYSDSARAKIGMTFLKQAAITKHASRYHAVANARKVLETYSTPFLYTLFYPLSRSSYESAYGYYQFVCMLCTVCTIVLLCMMTKASASFMLTFITFASVFFEPLRSDIRVANVNQIELGFLSVYLLNQLYVRWRFYNFTGGIILGLAVMFKPNLVFVIILLEIAWMMNRKYQKALQFGCGFGFACFTAILVSVSFLQSPCCWSDWINAIRLLPDSIITLKMGNLSLSAIMNKNMGIDMTIYLAASLILIVSSVLWRTRTRNSSGVAHCDRHTDAYKDSIIISMGCLIYLLSARLVWLHYYVLALPAVIISFRPYSEKRLLSNWTLFFRYPLVATMTAMIALSPIISLFIKSNYHQVAAVTVGLLIAFMLMFDALFELKFQSSAAIEN